MLFTFRKMGDMTHIKHYVTTTSQLRYREVFRNHDFIGSVFSRFNALNILRNDYVTLEQLCYSSVTIT